MIYEVRVRVVKEGTVFVEAKTQDEAKKAATSNVVAYIMMILAIAVGSLVIPWMLQDVEHSRNVEARCKSLGGQMGYRGSVSNYS